MSNKEEKLKNYDFRKDTIDMINSVCGILGFIGPILSTFFIYVWKFEFPRIIFIIFLVLLFKYGCKFLISIIRILCKNIKDYICKSKRLYITSKDDEGKKKNLYYDTRKLRNKILKRLFRHTIPRLIRLIIASILIFILCLTNPINTEAVWQGTLKVLFNLPSDDMSEVQTEQQKSDIKSTEEIDNLTDSTEDRKERKPPGYKFILINPDKIFELDSHIEAQVYFYDDATVSIDLITTYLSDLKENSKIGINIENKMYIEENEFKSKVAEYMDIEYLDDWYEVAPSSDELDIYIQKRNELNNTMIDGKQGCYELWWRLANDYQYYALEYEMQTNNETAVLYYYSMSIYCCMQALEYEMNDDMYDMIYHYMAMRYHDICRDDCIISSSYRKNAKVIYSLLEPNAIN